MANWRLAKSLEQLRKQVNAAAPNRSKASDGSVGDLSHQSRPSDHNPNAQGVVTAIDITHDPGDGVDGNLLSRALIHDSRVKYVIFNAQIWKARTGMWEPYRGANAHRKHVHVSVKPESIDNTNPWPWPVPVAVKTAPQVIGAIAAPVPLVVQSVSPEDAAKGVTTGNVTDKPSDGVQPPAEAVEVKASRPSLKSTAVAIFTFLMAPLSYIGIDARQVGEFAKGNLTLAIKVGAGLALVIIAAYVWNRAMDRAQERTNKLMDAAASKVLNNLRLVGSKDEAS